MFAYTYTVLSKLLLFLLHKGQSQREKMITEGYVCPVTWPWWCGAPLLRKKGNSYIRLPFDSKAREVWTYKPWDSEPTPSQILSQTKKEGNNAFHSEQQWIWSNSLRRGHFRGAEAHGTHQGRRGHFSSHQSHREQDGCSPLLRAYSTTLVSNGEKAGLLCLFTFYFLYQGK